MSKPGKRKIQYAVLLCVLIIGGITVGKAFVSSNDAIKIGGKPPEFRLLGTDDKVYNLSDYKGKALVINFWGTFCPPCVEEMPEFQRQWEKWRNEPFEILGINLSEDRLTASNFQKRLNITFPILYDQNRATERQYQLRSYPTTFFVHPDGTIMDIFVGGMTERDIDVRIRKLLNKS